MSSYDSEKIVKVLSVLLKKKYLLSRQDLLIEWRPLYRLYYHHEHSNAAARNLNPSVSGFKSSLAGLIKYARAYFSENATEEMLAEWRPLLYPADSTSVNLAFTYFSLFLPTIAEIPRERGYDLWFKEFQAFWNAYGNSPGWEVQLFTLLSRLALHNVGRIDWQPYLKSFFTKIMVSLNIPVTYGQSGLMGQFTPGTKSVRYISDVKRNIIIPGQKVGTF